MADYTGEQPNTAELEEKFLAACFIAPEMVADFADTLQPGDFFIIRHAWVWEAMVTLHGQGMNIDNATVAEEMKARGRLAEVGGPAGIIKLMCHPPTYYYAPTYAEMIRRAAYRRKALALASDMAKQAWSADITERDIQARIEGLVARLRAALPGDDGYHEGEHAQTDYEAIIAARLHEGAPDNFPVHLDALERYIPVIKPGKLVVLSGLSGHGKTIFMEEWAEWLAMLGNRVLYVTTELTAEDHLDRRYTRHSALPYQRIIAPTDEVKAAIEALRAKLGTWQHNLDFWEVNELGHEQVIAQMRRAHQHGRRAFFVDYFWEILEDDQRSTIDAAVKALHTFAKTTDSLVVVGSQLTETEHGLRTYGTRRLEQKCAVHLQIGRADKLKVPATYRLNGRVIELEAGEPDRFRELTIVKNTYGPAHVSVKLFLDGERLRFVDESLIGYGVARANRTPAATVTPDVLDVFRGGE